MSSLEELYGTLRMVSCFGLQNNLDGTQRLRSMKTIPEVGALTEWHRELRDACRTTLTVDFLYKAAVFEAQARDYERFGVRSAANEARQQAALLVLEVALSADAP